MAKISGLPDDLLVKILSFLPTKVAVSTSVLSKQWEFLWMWLPKLDYNEFHDITDSNSGCLRYRDFIDKNLRLHKAPIIESLSLSFRPGSLQPEDLKSWVGIAVSRCVRELRIVLSYFFMKPAVSLPSSLYTCKSLVKLKLGCKKILVDVPPIVCLPSLKTLKLRYVTYSNEESLQLLLSYCPVLEELIIERKVDDNVKAINVIVPSLQRLTLTIGSGCSSDGYVIVTPFLKYFKVEDHRESFSYFIEHMPELEEADIAVEQNPEKLLVSITSVKRLSLHIFFNSNKEHVCHAGIVFNQLEHLNICISNDYWSKLLVQLLKDSPKLRVLNLYVGICLRFEKYQPDSLGGSSIPKCLLKSLETFKFAGYKERPEDKDFLSFILKNACRLKSSSISSNSYSFMGV